MFDNFKIANYSNSLVSPELYARHFSRLITGNVIDGLTLVPKTGLTVTLQPGNALIAYGSGATASARMVSLVADFDITLSTADASNPRIDSIVCYVDMAVSLPSGTPTSANLDGPGVWKAVKVNGTPNASPVAPNSTAIQAAIGAGKPYFVAHDVRVDAGVTTIAANKITDRRALAMVSLAGALAASFADESITGKKLEKRHYIHSFRLINDTVQPAGWSGMAINADSSINGLTRSTNVVTIARDGEYAVSVTTRNSDAGSAGGIGVRCVVTQGTGSAVPAGAIGIGNFNTAGGAAGSMVSASGTLNLKAGNQLTFSYFNTANWRPSAYSDVTGSNPVSGDDRVFMTQFSVVEIR
ncbi:hypothetical protein [Rhodococcus aetherivorans]|uniref:hypothetical protein n=1 Tax=Rhodococcus aetherivorans TaxID=191292 RepID=UPI00388ECFDA